MIVIFFTWILFFLVFFLRGRVKKALLIIILLLYDYLITLCVFIYTCTMACVKKSEDDLQMCILSSCYAVSMGWIQVLKLDGKYLLLNHLARLSHCFRNLITASDLNPSLFINVNNLLERQFKTHNYMYIC